MVSFPVNLNSISGSIKALEKRTRDFLWNIPTSSSSSSAAPSAVDTAATTVTSEAPPPPPPPPVTVDTSSVAAVVADRFSSTTTEDAIAPAKTLEEEFQAAIGLEDSNKESSDSLDLREAKPRKFVYPPKRLDAAADDCSNYIRTGTCIYGANCGYNHPARKENQAQRSASSESVQVIKEKEKKDISEKLGQQECKYHLRSGGCKFGKACRYKHSREKHVVPPAPPLDFNFLGLPIRPGERECTQYMRTAACKHGHNCRFHHPDPTADGEGDIPSGSVSLHPSGALQSTSTPWSFPLNDTVPNLDAANPYVPGILPPQGVHPYPEWNGYQGERECTHGPNCRFHCPDPTADGEGVIPSGSVSLHPPDPLQPASTSWSSPPNGTVPYLDAANPYVPRMLPPQGVHPYTEWNGYQGERECPYYMHTGFCKYGPNCRFRHPDHTAAGGGDIPSGSVSLHPSGASQPASTSWSSPSNETVPYLDAANPYVPRMLPPQGVHPYPEWNGYQGERECTHYMRTGVCKHGPNCRFHHPDLTADGDRDIPSGSVSLHPPDPLQPDSTSWSLPPNETVRYLDAANPCVPRMLPPQGVHPYPEWNGYQTINFLNNEAEVRTSSTPMVWNNWNHPLATDATKASLRSNGTQPFFPANPSPLCWSKPKTRPAVNGTWKKGAKKTKTVQSGWCETCKIDCKSKDVLDQHKLGKKHMEKLEESKKEASAPAAKDPVVGSKDSPETDKGKTVSMQHGKKKEAPSFGPGEDLEMQMQELIEGGAAADAAQSVWCEISKIDCNSKNVLDQHKLVKKHQKNLEKLEESKQEGSAPAATAVLAAKDPVIGPKESPAADMVKTVSVQQGKKKGAPSLGPGENLETQMQELMEGEAVADAVQSAWCEICKIDCNNKNVLVQHKLGKKHKTKLEKLEESQKEGSAPAATAVPAAKDPMVGPKDSPAADKGKTVSVQHSKKKEAPSLGPGEDLETQMQELMEGGAAADAVESVWCEISKIDCNSKNVLDQHKLVKKHQKNLEKLEESKKEGSAPAATAVLAAKDPVIGPKESPAADMVKTVSVQQGKKKGAPSLGPGENLETQMQELMEGGAVADAVQSAWCEICKIDCNNKNVLVQHKLGKKHKTKLEKLEESQKEGSAPAATAVPAAKDPIVGPKDSPAADKGKTVSVQHSKKKEAPSLGPGEDLETQMQELMEGGAAADAVESVWCEISKIDCNSKNVLDQHKLGKKDKKNIEKLEESKKEASAPAATAAPAANNPLIGPKESPAVDKGKTVSVQQGKKKGAPSLGPGVDLETQMKKLMDGGVAADALRVCTICNVVCNSQTVFTNHLAGQKHANMVKKQAAAAETANPPGPGVVTAA